MVAAAIVGGAAISGVASIAGGAMGAGAAGKAAQAQKEQYQQTRADLLPYNLAGQTALPGLQALAQGGPTGGGPDYVKMAEGKLPGSVFTQADLEATPGYQFTLGQGLKATQSARAAKGLGVSGAALKGAATYATGLADSTYANRFNEAQQNFNDILSLNTGQQGVLTNQYNRLSGLATLGANAAATTGQQGTQLANQAGNALMQGGQAMGSGIAGVGNAIGGGINNYLKYGAMQQGANAGGTSGYTAAN